MNTLSNKHALFDCIFKNNLPEVAIRRVEHNLDLKV